MGLRADGLGIARVRCDQRKQQPMTKTMKISDVRSQLNTLVDGVFRQETRVLVQETRIP